MSEPRPRLFGTDGIRAAFGTHPLEEGTVRRLGMVVGSELLERESQLWHPQPHVVIGGDTRDSTPILCRWLAEGLAGCGVTYTYLGTVPTPGVAALTRALGAACGIAVSASHNPHPDNGVKLIDPRGFKLSHAIELRLEERLAAAAEGPTAADLGPLEVDAGAVESYLRSLAATVPEGRPGGALADLRVALDAGHGAASPYAGELFARLGAQVTVRYAEPDGRNINAGCGATHPEVVAELTRATGSDLGFAFDGDADRAMMADDNGEVCDGDAILYLWARELKRQNRLPGARIVATSMSNLGLEVALRRSGISVVRCDVGDRAVVETMQRKGIVLGGEQSGHIVDLSLSTQGDGLLTALQLAALRLASNRLLSELLAGFKRFPQLLKNVRVRRKPELESLPRVVAARDLIVERLGRSGRLVLRYSGTEPLARIMIEGRDRAEIEEMAEDLAVVITEELS